MIILEPLFLINHPDYCIYGISKQSEYTIVWGLLEGQRAGTCFVLT